MNKKERNLIILNIKALEQAGFNNLTLPKGVVAKTYYNLTKKTIKALKNKKTLDAIIEIFPDLINKDITYKVAMYTNAFQTVMKGKVVKREKEIKEEVEND
jgi:hypothetical protein